MCRSMEVDFYRRHFRFPMSVLKKAIDVQAAGGRSGQSTHFIGAMRGGGVSCYAPKNRRPVPETP